MKILIPYFGVHDFDVENSKVQVGGVEKFIQDIWKNFSDIHVLRINKDESKSWKANIDRTIKKINEIKPDLIINNYIGGGGGGTFGPTLAKYTNVPIMMICNISPGSIGSLGAVHNMKIMIEQYDYKLFMVSPHQGNLWNKLSQRINSQDLHISGYVAPGTVINKNIAKNIADCEYDIVTIGRCEANPKNPFLVHEIGKKYGLKSLVISNVIEGDYYEKNKNWNGNQVTLWNLEHSKVMEELSKCKVFVATCNSETYCIAALEAYSYGLSLMLNHFKNGHASECIIPNKDYYKLFDKRSFKSQFDSLILNDETRSKIIEDNYVKNNIDNWKIEMQKAFELSASVNKKTSLENFL